MLPESTKHLFDVYSPDKVIMQRHVLKSVKEARYHSQPRSKKSTHERNGSNDLLGGDSKQQLKHSRSTLSFFTNR